LNNERIYPSWGKINEFVEPLTEGKKTLIRYLDDNLSKDWKIFIKPYLNGSNPDLIILNPNSGVMIFEVIEKSSEINKGNNTPSNLIKKVNYYKNKIIEQLIPDIGEKIDENGKIFAIFKSGIYVHDLEGKDARKLFKNPQYESIIGCDDLKSSNLKNVVPGTNFPNSRLIRKEWAHEIELWVNPPFHKSKKSEIVLNKKQRDHSEPKQGHRRLRGAAGSGKTLVIAYRAAKLASEGYNVLIITFNLNMWHYIRDMVENTPFDFKWSNITFNHFHGFCNDILNHFSVPKPKNYLEDIVSTVEDIVTNKNIDNLKFDAILIDEGQDYEWKWYNLLSKFLKERDELLLVCDKNQNIYERDLGWLDSMENVKFRGRWGELNTVNRLPKKIGDMVNEFSSKFEIDQTVEVEKYRQLSLYEKPPALSWKNIEFEDWNLELMEAYQKILDLKEGNASDIAILLPTKKMGKEAVKLFKENHIPVNHFLELENQERDFRNKKAFVNKDGRLKISTVHSFKGWEALHIITLVTDEWTDYEFLDLVTYTAMTRTKKNLVVLNCNERYWSFGEDIIQNNSIDEESDEIDAGIENIDEIEIEDWMETLPYPISSILLESFISLKYEYKVKYLLKFFEAFVEFNFNLMLSGLSKDELFYNREVSRCINNAAQYKEEWYNEPSFGNWYNLNNCFANNIRRILNDKYERNQCLKLFGKPKIEFLKQISSVELMKIFKKVKDYRNIWDGHGPLVSEEENEKRFETLETLLFKVKDIIRTSFGNTFLVMPVENEFKDGIYYYKARKLMGTNSRFKPINIESEIPMDKNKVYMITKNKRMPIELLPLIMVQNDICYYYNGKDYENDQARYCSYHYEREPELYDSMDKLSDLISLFEPIESY